MTETTRTSEWFCQGCGYVNGLGMTAIPASCMRCGLSHTARAYPAYDPRTGKVVDAPSTNFVQLGRWSQCAHCGTVHLGINPNSHYCGAPWQSPASDIPADWIAAARSPAPSEGPTPEQSLNSPRCDSPLAGNFASGGNAKGVNRDDISHAVRPDDQQNVGVDELPACQTSFRVADQQRVASIAETDNGRGVTSAGGESGLPHRSSPDLWSRTCQAIDHSRVVEMAHTMDDFIGELQKSEFSAKDVAAARRFLARVEECCDEIPPALPVPAQEAEALGNYTHDAEILRAFVRKVAPGGCKVVSLGAACPCPLCAVDRLAARLRSPSEIPEARRVRDLVQFHRSESCEGERCTMCGKPAAMKVGEEIAHDDPFPNRHNFTAYVCLECGNRILCPYVFASRSPEETPGISAPTVPETSNG